MGDRGNIAVLQQDGQVWFYTHWRGYSIKEITQEALVIGKDRWQDESYLARIIFGTLSKDASSHITGFGISTSITDNEYPVVVVDVPKQRVFLVPKDELKDGQVPPGYVPEKTWTFQQFCDATLTETEAA